VREPKQNGEWIDWRAEPGDASFQAGWSSQHVVVTCRGTKSDEMNRLIDIAAAHDCRLYDPRVNERFG
jgi:hypothetical protein